MARRKTPETETVTADREKPTEATVVITAKETGKDLQKMICPICVKEGLYKPGVRRCVRCNVQLMTEEEFKAFKAKKPVIRK